MDINVKCAQKISFLSELSASVFAPNPQKHSYIQDSSDLNNREIGKGRIFISSLDLKNYKYSVTFGVRILFSLCTMKA